MKNRLFRENIEAMKGYTPGEQPQRIGGWIKLNTNENPYPPSPAVDDVLRSSDPAALRLYPDPVCGEIRRTIADLYGFTENNILVGNGSDDILTIAVRSFVPENGMIASPDPSYSLYPVLASIQGAECIKIPLNSDFTLPANFAESAEGASLIMIPRPNAPTGTAFELEKMRQICREFSGIVLIDEAYADFSDDNCIEFVKEFPNVIISRTLSKSYSLAGIRLGYVIASEEIINGMMKVKDSYNVNTLTQKIAVAALRDQEYLKANISKICEVRKYLADALTERNFKVIDSQTNFIFAAPPDEDGEKLYNSLKDQGILVRWFPGEETGKYIRITIGTKSEIDQLLKCL
jgi:histidinol-phosphate aminotransferase